MPSCKTGVCVALVLVMMIWGDFLLLALGLGLTHYAPVNDDVCGDGECEDLWDIADRQCDDGWVPCVIELPQELSQFHCDISF